MRKRHDKVVGVGNLGCLHDLVAARTGLAMRDVVGYRPLHMEDTYTHQPGGVITHAYTNTRAHQPGRG
jgi:hypothetical protein